MAPLEALGFALAGYGCTTCIGNSGPLDEPVARAVEEHDLVVAAVLSGNRNFEGRIHPLARASLPRLAAARRRVRARRSGRHRPDPRAARARSATAGRSSSPTSGRRRTRSARSSATSIDPALFRATYAIVFEGDDRWRALPIPAGDRYAWEADSTYIARPPFFDGRDRRAGAGRGTSTARASSRSSATRSRPTTSRPAGSIAPWSPAGQWLQAHGVGPLEFNSYGARRGHHEVMMRGTFANIRLRNRLAAGRGGPVHGPPARRRARRSSTTRRCATAARASRSSSSPAGSTAPARRATGPPRARCSSASGPSSPRASSGSIARNLVGMGVLPLQFDARRERGARSG